MFVPGDQPSGWPWEPRTNAIAPTRATLDDVPPRPRIVEAVAVHDDAMLSRMTSVLALHPVGSFSYTLEHTRDGDRALVRLEVLGGAGQETRVRHKLRRLIGVLHVSGAGTD